MLGNLVVVRIWTYLLCIQNLQNRQDLTSHSSQESLSLSHLRIEKSGACFKVGCRSSVLEKMEAIIPEVGNRPSRADEHHDRLSYLFDQSIEIPI